VLEFTTYANISLQLCFATVVYGHRWYPANERRDP